MENETENRELRDKGKGTKNPSDHERKSLHFILVSRLSVIHRKSCENIIN